MSAAPCVEIIPNPRPPAGEDEKTYRSISPETQSFHSSPNQTQKSWHASVNVAGREKLYLIALLVVDALHRIPRNIDRIVRNVNGFENLIVQCSCWSSSGRSFGGSTILMLSDEPCRGQPPQHSEGLSWQEL